MHKKTHYEGGIVYEQKHIFWWKLGLVKENEYGELKRMLEEQWYFVFNNKLWLLIIFFVSFIHIEKWNKIILSDNSNSDRDSIKDIGVYLSQLTSRNLLINLMLNPKRLSWIEKRAVLIFLSPIKSTINMDNRL